VDKLDALEHVAQDRPDGVEVRRALKPAHSRLSELRQQPQQGLLSVGQVLALLDLAQVLPRPLCGRLCGAALIHKLVPLFGVIVGVKLAVLVAALNAPQPSLRHRKLLLGLRHGVTGEAQVGDHPLRYALPGLVEVYEVRQQVAEQSVIDELAPDGRLLASVNAHVFAGRALVGLARAPRHGDHRRTTPAAPEQPPCQQVPSLRRAAAPLSMV
jgi:hypothetical protein